MGALRAVPTGALYSILLVLHVLFAVVGFGSVGVTGLQASRARRGPQAPGAEAVRRYFRPGVNWAGRSLYAVPLLGFCLIAASNRAFDAGDSFVVAGLVLWLAAVLVAEAVLWPAERRIQVEMARRWDEGDPVGPLDEDCRRAVACSAVLVAIFVAATVLMVGKP
ncbi:MAG TPA: DUF2269 family protein [Acidimicrobiales bacterium]|nr:DUF2269 family protein [Acidimicrobiales bacterium]